MQNKTVDVGAVIDSAKFFWVPCGIAAMMIIIMLTDGYDLFLMGTAGPFILDDWKVGGAALQPINSWGLIGMAAGSVSLGWLGDRIGRKRSYFTCLVFLFIGSVMSYLTAKAGTPATAEQSIHSLTMWRFVTGLGMGGVTPLATTLISEWTSQKVRSVVVALVISSVPMGGSLAAFASKHVAWPQMFLLGGLVPLALFILFGFLLPESPKYMAQHPAQHPRLAKALNRLLGEKRFDGSENFRVAEAGKRSSNWLSTIWNSTYAKATLLIWIAFSVNSFVLYIYTNQLRLVIKDRVAVEAAANAVSLFSLGAFFGSIGGAFLIRWFGSRYVGSALAMLGVVGTALIAVILTGTVSPSITALNVFTFAVGMSINGMQAFMYAVSAHSYPTEIRGSAVGMAQTVSRIGAVASPSFAAYYLSMSPKPGEGVFFWFIAVSALVTTISFFLIPSHIPSSSSHDTGGGALEVEGLKEGARP